MLTCAFVPGSLYSVPDLDYGVSESAGLVPNATNSPKLRYNANINRPRLGPGVERRLNNITPVLAIAKWPLFVDHFSLNFEVDLYTF